VFRSSFPIVSRTRCSPAGRPMVCSPWLLTVLARGSNREPATLMGSPRGQGLLAAST
jgi:hypothetical protein